MILIETALKLAEGLMSAEIQTIKDSEEGEREYDISEELFSQNLSCPDCGISWRR